MKQYKINKYLDQGQTINSIVYILQSIGMFLNEVTFNHVGAILSIISLALLITGMVKIYKEQNGNITNLSSFIHALFLSIMLLLFYVLIVFVKEGNTI